MAEVNIPDEAMDAADRVYGIGSNEEYERLRATLAAAAPLIVAAELERLSHEFIGEENANRLWRSFLQRAAQLRGAV